MTHTLHRYGRPEDFRDDYIVTAMPARGFNDEGCIPKQKLFLRTALKHGPVNIGNSIKGSAHRATKDLRPSVHWNRDHSPDPEVVIEEVDRPTTVSAVFDNPESMRAFVAELKELDLGLSVNIAGVVESAVACCRDTGLTRHSVEYSLGFQGAIEKMPEDQSRRLLTMCGHGMVSASLTKKMVEWVRSGRRTPEQACAYLARFCACGSFNPARAERVLREAAAGATGEE
jgi:hypothetical protein